MADGSGTAQRRGGCIVTRNGSPMELVAGAEGLPAAGVLMHGRFATVFRSAAAARAALRRTWACAERKGHDWGQRRRWEWHLWRLREA